MRGERVREKSEMAFKNIETTLINVA